MAIEPIDTISRRRVLKMGATTGTLGLMAGRVSAKRFDQDMDPYIFGVTEADLQNDGTIVVSGPCEVPDPPEQVDLHVQVRGNRGTRAVGDATVSCNHPENESDTFSVSTTTRSARYFDEGDTVTVCTKALIKPDDKPAAVVRWCKDVTLS